MGTKFSNVIISISCLEKVINFKLTKISLSPLILGHREYSYVCDSLAGAVKHDTDDHKRSIDLQPTSLTQTKFIPKSVEGKFVVKCFLLFYF